MARVLFDHKPEEPGFFSLKNTYNIGGVRFRPAICYPMPELLKEAVKGLAAKGEAFLYLEEQVFINGVPTPRSGFTDGRPQGTQLSPATANWQHPSDPVEGEKL